MGQTKRLLINLVAARCPGCERLWKCGNNPFLSDGGIIRSWVTSFDIAEYCFRSVPIPAGCSLLLTVLVLPVSWEISSAGPLCWFHAKKDKRTLWVAPTHTPIQWMPNIVSQFQMEQDVPSAVGKCHLICPVWRLFIVRLQGEVHRINRLYCGAWECICPTIVWAFYISDIRSKLWYIV